MGSSSKIRNCELNWNWTIWEWVTHYRICLFLGEREGRKERAVSAALLLLGALFPITDCPESGWLFAEVKVRLKGEGRPGP